MQIPKAVTPDFQIVDQLPAGMSFLNDGSAKVAFVSVSGNAISSSDTTINGLAGLNFTGTSSSVTPTAMFPAGDISGGTGTGGAFQDGNQPVFSFSNITNSDTNTADAEYVVLEFNALVDNVAVNTTGHADVNTFIDKANGTQVGPASNTETVTVVQPSITNESKTVQSTGRDPGDTVSYQVTYSNTGNADAFDARLVDILPATLSFNVGSVTETLGGGASGVTNNSASNTMDVTIADFPAGGTVQIDYTATILTTDSAGSVIDNTANLTYTSLPGPFGTTVNPTGSSTPGSAGSATGERNGSGGVNSYFGSSSQSITVNSSTLTGFVYQDLQQQRRQGCGRTRHQRRHGDADGDQLPRQLRRRDHNYQRQRSIHLHGSPAQQWCRLHDHRNTAGRVPGRQGRRRRLPTSPAPSAAGSNVGSITANLSLWRHRRGPGIEPDRIELQLRGAAAGDRFRHGLYRCQRRRRRAGGRNRHLRRPVELQGTDDLGNTVTQFTSTNGSGNYSFTTLRPGTYFISLPTQPAGYFGRPGKPGEHGRRRDRRAATNGQDRIPLTGTFSLGVGATNANNMFGELQPASLAGFVYVDANNDGIKEAGEAGIGNVTVTLTGTNDLGNSVNVPTTTLSDGSYSFSNLRPGTYTITESQPAAYEEGKDAIGTPGGNATVQDVFSNIVLAEGVNGVNNNFGERLTADLAINKTDNQTTAVPGTPITYVITITNNGPSTVNSLTMNDAVPAAILDPVFSNPSSGSYNSGTGAWTGLTLASGQSITIQLSGTVSPSVTGNLVNTATVSGGEDGSGNPILDPVSSNNSSTDTDLLTPEATLTISKTDGS